ncbi:unnamed protein product [marine sediment metagenome]|uniref:Uncharacterized protein n=1 Tax=marine sediment metagenome TaxID=412755 RepID=X0VBQ6_9ZZZZ
MIKKIIFSENEFSPFVLFLLKCGCYCMTVPVVIYIIINAWTGNKVKIF